MKCGDSSIFSSVFIDYAEIAEQNLRALKTRGILLYLYTIMFNITKIIDKQSVKDLKPRLTKHV